MTELVKKKVELKKKIRSLLLSAPLGLTLEELVKDYYSFIGERLPTRELGYSSVEELLLDIPDAVQVTKNNDRLFLKAVSDASTQNIEKLVSKQKVDSRKRWGVLSVRAGGNLTCKGRGRGMLNTHGSSGKNLDKKEGIALAHQPQRGSPVKHARHRIVPVVSAFVRSQIHELVKRYPSGIPLTHISNIFYKHYGLHLDHQSMGFSSEYDLFASLADIVTLKKLSFGEIWILSVESALALEGCHSHQRQEHISGSNLETDTRPASREIQLKDTPGTQPVTQSPVTDPDLEAGKDDPETNIDLYIHCNIPETVQDNIRQIMSQRPNGIYASRLPFEYKKDLPYKTYGYNSIIEFAADLTHIVQIRRPHPQGDWHLLPVTSQLSTEHPSATSTAKQQNTLSTDVEVEVDQSTKEAISQVLSMHPDGIPLEKFESIYKLMTGETLDYIRHGARDLQQFFHAVPDVLISSNMQGKPVVCQKIKVGPRRFDRLQIQYHPLTVVDGQLDKPVLHLPSDAVSPGCCYTPQPLPVFQDESIKYIDLYVSYVISPDIFWIQLRGRNTTLALEDLMDDLEKVYRAKHLPLDYHMTTSVAKPGMICTAIFPEDGHWYRAIITNVKDQLFEVYYVDYGNVCAVSISSLRLLKTKFLKFPVQAIRARLSNIQPVDGVWRANSKTRLLELCREKPLVAFVTNIKDGVMSLCLTDTTNEYDIHINDVFVSEGYAVLSPDDDQTEAVSHAKVPSRELLYGDNAFSTNPDNSSPVSSSRRYIRQVQMTDDVVMNLINLDDQLYILSSEISHLFFSEDFLSAQLCKDNVDVSKVVVTRKNQPGLFNELAIYGAANFNDNTNVLSLFPLSELPLIVSLYGKEGQFEDIKATALEILKWFNPDDPYWRCEDDTGADESSGVDTHSSVGDASDLPGLDDLQLVLSSLVIKRKRILHQMLAGGSCKASSVNDLNDVEWDITRVEALITKLQNVLHAAASDQSSATATLADSGMSLTPEGICHAQLPALAAQLKTTQRVAPMMQASSVPPEAEADLTKLLEEHVLMNTLLLEQLRISQEATSLQALTGQLPLSRCSQGINMQPGPLKENPTTMVTQSILNPLLSSGNPPTSSYSQLPAPLATSSYSQLSAPLATSSYSQLSAPLATPSYSQLSAPLATSSYSQFSAPLATSTPGAGTAPVTPVSDLLGSVRRNLPLDMYNSQLQQLASLPPQSLHMQHLLQNQIPGQENSYLHSEQSPDRPHVPHLSPHGTHMPQPLPPHGTDVPQQFHNLNAWLAMGLNPPDLDSLSNFQLAGLDNLATSQFAGFTGFTSLNLPGQHNIPGGLTHNIQGTMPSWYTARSSATAMPLPGSMASSQTVFPSSSLNYSLGVSPADSTLSHSLAGNALSHSLAGSALSHSLAGSALSHSLAGGALSHSLAGGALSHSLAGSALSHSLAGGVLMHNRLAQQQAPGLSGCPDLLSLLLSRGTDSDMFATKPGSGV